MSNRLETGSEPDSERTYTWDIEGIFTSNDSSMPEGEVRDVLREALSVHGIGSYIASNNQKVRMNF